MQEQVKILKATLKKSGGMATSEVFFKASIIGALIISIVGGKDLNIDESRAFFRSKFAS
jgi:hypothetical protein